jgi:hypothetical protein
VHATGGLYSSDLILMIDLVTSDHIGFPTLQILHRVFKNGQKQCVSAHESSYTVRKLDKAGCLSLSKLFYEHTYRIEN